MKPLVSSDSVVNMKLGHPFNFFSLIHFRHEAGISSFSLLFSLYNLQIIR